MYYPYSLDIGVTVNSGDNYRHVHLFNRDILICIYS